MTIIRSFFIVIFAIGLGWTSVSRSQTSESAPSASTDSSVGASASQNSGESSEVPLTKLQGSRTSDFATPMYFADKSFDFYSSLWNWEYEVGPSQLMVSGQKVDLQTFGMSLQQTDKKIYWVFKWPEKILSAQQLVVRDIFGEVVWDLDLQKSDESKSWQRSKPSGLREWNFGWVLNKVSDLPILKGATGFKWCVVSAVEDVKLQLCSGLMSLRRDDKGQISFFREEKKLPLVLHQGKVQPEKGRLGFAARKRQDSFLISGVGDSLSLTGELPSLDLIEIIEVAGRQVRILGDGRPPLTNKFKFINAQKESLLIRLVGFEDTLKLQKQIWSLTVPKTYERVYFASPAGGMFSFLLPQGDLVASFLRLHLETDAPKQTYNSSLDLEGRKIPQATLEKAQGKVEVDPANPSHFEWSASTPKRGDYNSPRLEVNYEGRKIQQTYEIYRGVPGEVSLRGSGFLASTSSLLLGELAFNYWFESIAGWNNDLISRQRWGINTRVNKSVNKLKIQSTSGEADLEMQNVELKYRLSQGLWTRNESLGLQLSYQKVKLDVMDAPMVGGGIFWARSMPRVFDNVFNLIPFFRYPKWVDMDFSVYSMSLNRAYQVGTNYSVNFHGQMLFSEQAFFEVGFGVRGFSFQNKEIQQKAVLNTFYGTTGLGYKF